MPYVIEIQPDAVDRMFNKSAAALKYYAGPVSLPDSFMGLARAAANTGKRKIGPIFDALRHATPNINSATRVSAKGLMDNKAAELRRAGLDVRVVYDTPIPLKMLQWLVTPPARS